MAINDENCQWHGRVGTSICVESAFLFLAFYGAAQRDLKSASPCVLSKQHPIDFIVLKAFIDHRTEQPSPLLGLSKLLIPC